ncbi:MAG: N-formylglutamate amidohydrolase [Hyphomonadaceae bacterium]
MREWGTATGYQRDEVGGGPASRPPAYRLLRPLSDKAGVIVCCPHSGRFYPDDLLRGSKLDRLALRRSEDAFVDELFAASPELGASLLMTDFARAYVDLNRGPEEFDPELIDGLPQGDRRVPSPRVLAGLGVIPRTVGDGVDIYTGRLAFAEVQARLDEVYAPWHGVIEDLIDGAKQTVGHAVVLDCHSMPASASGSPENDIVLGDRFGASCAPVYMAEAFTYLRSKGLRVARNNPYAGGYATERYGKPGQNQHSLQIEINRSLYMVEGAMSKRTAFSQMAELLAGLVMRLVAVAEEKATVLG